MESHPNACISALNRPSTPPPPPPPPKVAYLPTLLHVPNFPRFYFLNRISTFPESWKLFSAPEPKAQVHYRDHVLSVVRRPSSLTFHIFDFSSETAEQNLTKLYRKVDLNVLYQVCVFSGRSEKQDGRPGLWLAETFSTSPLKLLNGIQRNLMGSKISTSSTKFGFFGPIGKTRWPPWPLIGWDIFDFSSETAERNSTKLDRKQDLNVLYQVCVFLGRLEKQDGRPGLWLAETFSTLSAETAEQISKKLDRKQDLNVLYQVCVFRADRKNKMAALASDWPRHFRLLLWNR